jgi:hypothetical protein
MADYEAAVAGGVGPARAWERGLGFKVARVGVGEESACHGLLPRVHSPSKSVGEEEEEAEGRWKCHSGTKRTQAARSSAFGVPPKNATQRLVLSATRAINQGTGEEGSITLVPGLSSSCRWRCPSREAQIAVVATGCCCCSSMAPSGLTQGRSWILKKKHIIGIENVRDGLPRRPPPPSSSLTQRVSPSPDVLYIASIRIPIQRLGYIAQFLTIHATSVACQRLQSSSSCLQHQP